MWVTINVPEEAVEGWIDGDELAEVLVDAFKLATKMRGHWIPVGNKEFKCSRCGAIHVWQGKPLTKCQECGTEMYEE